MNEAEEIVSDVKSETESLEVVGARVHNLKNIDVSIPRNKLVVITGLSGSGKSSLAFDTIYAEGQRRYIETFSTYARQFLGGMERPDVDKITGLSPVISIEQKTVSRNPRSTAGTITEVYDFMRLLFARVSDAYSYMSGEKMVRYTSDQILDLIRQKFKGQKIYILAPLVRSRKGHYRDLFEQLRKNGFTKVRIDGPIHALKHGLSVDRYKIHDIEIVIDLVEVRYENEKRLIDSTSLAMKQGKGTLMVMKEGESTPTYFSKNLMCPSSGISYDEPQPNTFSFNSPYGACQKCNGLGHISEIDIHKIIPDFGKSIYKGGIIPIGEYKPNWIFRQIEAIAQKYHFSMKDPIKKVPEHALNIILYGADEIFKVKTDPHSNAYSYSLSFEGIVNFLVKQNDEAVSPAMSRWVEEFMNEKICPECNGSRLKKEAQYFKIGKKSISDLSSMDIIELQKWFNTIESALNPTRNIIAKEILKEIRKRIQFLLDVGLDYITLDRSAQTLSGGEAQRIRLATQIGSQLVNVLYILDEPSIGLHQRDNKRLIKALQDLRDIGNSVIVVEHDKEMILAADHIIDVGPAAGVHGGRIVKEGAPEEFLKVSGSVPMAIGIGVRRKQPTSSQLQTPDSQLSLTSQYLSGEKSIAIPFTRRKGTGEFLTIKGAKGNNLKNLTVKFPLGKFICVTGVSGSGKSTLINETLYPILSNHFYRSHQKPLDYESIEGLGNIDKVIEVDQSPIGRTPRSNPATYTGVFSEIRTLFTMLPEAKIRGYKPGRFSFNVKGGRCETCQGAGVRTIEMNFLPDVYVVCETCGGKRYNRETLEIRYKGKSISDVLNMSVEEAVPFFENIPNIIQKIRSLKSVGLNYITLGQSSVTLSGGEAQRVKLATELAKRDTGKTLYILDEPTTGLHFEDIRILLEVLDKLTESGNTVLVIEHNMDVIKVADHIIDVGPEGGEKGGMILCEGTPEDIIKNEKSHTAQYLRKELVNIDIKQN
ncbi:MAG: excinuclease ABC subunit A [Bacteroidetes bacterium]|nr:MAG: excinuclease ABC subunit A [Bacteroidota bacterium]